MCLKKDIKKLSTNNKVLDSNSKKLINFLATLGEKRAVKGAEIINTPKESIVDKDKTTYNQKKLKVIHGFGN